MNATARRRERGRRGEGRGDAERLAAIYGRFTKALDAPDLREAAEFLK